MLQIRYHENFLYGRPALLFAGSIDDLHNLELFFDSWRGEKVDLIATAKRQHEIYTLGVKKLFIEVDQKKTNSIFGIDGSDMYLLLSKEDKTKIAGLIEGLKVSNRPGHQYLHSKEQMIQVIFSKDEYTLPASRTN